MKAFFAGLIVLGLQMLTLTAAEEPEVKPVFEDRFDSTLAKGWSWMHERRGFLDWIRSSRSTP